MVQPFYHAAWFSVNTFREKSLHFLLKSSLKVLTTSTNCAIIKVSKGERKTPETEQQERQVKRPVKQTEDFPMTDKQADKTEVLARIDELDRLEEVTTDPATLIYITARKKALRIALDKLLNA